MISFSDFEKVDIRVGRIIGVADFPEARNPSYKIEINFGKEIGIKKSSVQLCGNYTKDELLGKLILGVVNFPPKQIGPFISEVLTLGVLGKNKHCILVIPEKEVNLGEKLY